MARRIVILGGGPAGYEAALVAADAGAQVTLVSDQGLGGNCVLTDCVPSKALIVAAEAMGWMRTAGELGVRLPGDVQLDRTVVDFPAVAARIRGLARAQSDDITRRVSVRGVELLTGRGRVSAERQVTAETGGGDEVRPADHVLVATGSRPRVLDFFDPDGERVLLGWQVYDLPEVPERLVVVGSGATGTEFAHAFVRLGSEVVLVSSRDRILPTEDPDAAAVIEQVFERQGMTILRGVRAVGCEPGAAGVRVGLDDGSSVEGSHALFAVGQVPATANVGLETVGVAVDDGGGIGIDAVGRTSQPWLYAAGDVVGRVMLASVAAMQGRTAMWHALGQAVAPIRWDAMAATVFTGPEVATVGLSPADAEAQRIPCRSARLDFVGNARAKMDAATDGFVKVHAMPGSGIVLGAVVVAAAASELIQPLAVAVQQRLTVQQVAQTLTVYPAMSGSVAECCRMLMAELT